MEKLSELMGQLLMKLSKITSKQTTPRQSKQLPDIRWKSIQRKQVSLVRDIG